MPIVRSCRMAAGSLPAFLLLLLGMAGCAAPGSMNTASPPAAASMDAPIPPKDALAFEDAVDRLTTALFARAQFDPAEPTPRPLVIDPLIDRATGNQAVATRSMERRMADLVRRQFRQIEPLPFTAENIASRPLVLVGSITPVASPGIVPPTTAPTQTYRIWAALADLRTNRIVSHETAWVRAEGVDMTPTPFFKDSPAWLADTSQASYIKTCAGNPGDPIDAGFVRGLFAAAAINDAVRAYEGGQYREALVLYARARAQPEGDQLRVYNGLYLANAALGRDQEAEQAFGALVGYGLRNGKLAVKFVFRPNSTRFWPDRSVSGAYPMWLRQIAIRGTEQAACLRLVGHTSPTGTRRANDALSLARAATVRSGLQQQSRVLAERTEIEGRGSAQPLVGSGRDDATDVLDRRVEFETRPCLQAVLPTRGA